MRFSAATEPVPEQQFFRPFRGAFSIFEHDDQMKMKMAAGQLNWNGKCRQDV